MSCCAFSWPFSSIAATFTFDDIDFWVGEGSNRAALVIDWIDDSTEQPALVWGYRWDGEALGNDMLEAVVTADDRLFAKLAGPPNNPLAVYGLGYDADNDGDFGLDDNTTFNEAGIAFTSPADGAQAVDADDHYAEGWFAGFWHYGIASTSPYDGGTWSDTPQGVYARPLADGAWDSWVFTPTFDFAAFAENPVAAPAPGGQLLGDYNQNNAIDAADYGVWRDVMAAAGSFLPNDPTPGSVDESDFFYWRAHFGESLGSGAGGTAGDATVVPEPSTTILVACALLIILTLGSTKPLMDADRR